MELPRVAGVLAAEEERVALRPGAAAAAVAEEEHLPAALRISLELPRVVVAVLSTEEGRVALRPAAEEEDLLALRLAAEEEDLLAALHPVAVPVIRPEALLRLLLSHDGPPA